MYQALPIAAAKSAHHFPGRLLFQNPHAIAVEIQHQPAIHQLMKSLVLKPGCRIDATSIIGVKLETSSIRAAEACTRSDFKSHRISLARLCPNGSNRWQAEISAATEECR